MVSTLLIPYAWFGTGYAAGTLVEKDPFDTWSPFARAATFLILTLLWPADLLMGLGFKLGEYVHNN